MANLTKNHILAALPRVEYERIAPSLQPEKLLAGSVLCESGEPLSHVYFLNTGMVSLVSLADDRSFLEVGMIGSEGMVGIWATLGLNRMPQRAIVQLPGHAMKIKLGLVKNEFNRGGELQRLLHRSMQLLHFQVSQSAVCNRFHPTEARLCRWLLMCRDRVNSNDVPLTQEFLSQMLGAARPMVSFAAANLQNAGIIQYTRGRITILDPARLKSNACECYRIVTNEYRAASRKS
jgi:CRP-like cAMP-binding protein